MALKNITSGHRDLREVTIHILFYVVFIDNLADARQAVGDETHALWMDLDRLLIRLSESDAVRVRVRCRSLGGDTETREYAESLLPEVARGGSGRLVDYAYDDV